MAEKSPNPDWLKYGEMITCLFIQNIITMKERDKFLDRLDKKFDSLASGCGDAKVQESKGGSAPVGSAEFETRKIPTPTSFDFLNNKYDDRWDKSEIVEWAKRLKDAPDEFAYPKTECEAIEKATLRYFLTLILKRIDKLGYCDGDNLEVIRDEIRKALGVLEEKDGKGN